VNDQLILDACNSAVAPAQPHRFTKIEIDDGYWLQFYGYRAYLGPNVDAALRTAILGDWYLEERDGPITSEIQEFLDTREVEEDTETQALDWANNPNGPFELKHTGEELRRYEQNRAVVDMNRALLWHSYDLPSELGRLHPLDEGEPLTPEDVAKIVTTPRTTLETDRTILYSLWYGGGFGWFRGWKPWKKRSELYMLSDDKSKCQVVSLRVTDTGAVLKRTGKVTKLKEKYVPLKAVDIIWDKETQTLLNLRWYQEIHPVAFADNPDSAHTQLRLVGEQGRIILKELNLGAEERKGFFSWI